MAQGVRIGSAFINVTANTGEAEGAFGRLTSVVGGVAKAAGIAAAALGGFALFRGIGRALDLEDAEASMRGLGASTEQVDDAMAAALSSVLDTQFGLDQAAQAAQTLAAAGIPIDDLEASLKALSDTATVGRGDFEGVADVFTTVAATGKVTGRELRRLQQRGIPALALLAGELGVSAEAARDLVSTGQVDFPTFVAAMGTLSGAAEAAGATTRGAFRNVGAAFARLGQTAVEPFLGQVVDMAFGFRDLVDTITARVEPAFQTAADLIGGIVDAFAEADGIIPGIIGAWRTLGDQIDWPSIFSGLLDAAQGAFDTVVEWVGGPGFGDLIERLVIGRVNLLNAAVDLFLALVDGLLQALPKVVDAIGTQVLPALVKVIQVEVPAILNAALTLFSGLVDAVVQIIPELVQTVATDVIPAVVTAVTEGLPELIGGMTEAASGLIVGIATAIPDIISVIVEEMIPAVVGAIVEAAPLLLAAAVEAFGQLVGAVGEIVPAVVEEIGVFNTAAIGAVLLLGPQLLRVAGIAFGGLVTAARTAATGVGVAMTGIRAALGPLGLILGGITLAIGLFSSASADASESLSGFDSAIDIHLGSLAALREELRDTDTAMDEFASSVEDEAHRAIREFVRDNEDLISVMEITGITFGDLEAAAAGTPEALEKVTDAASDLHWATQQARQANEDLSEAWIAQVRPLSDASESLADFVVELAESGEEANLTAARMLALEDAISPLTPQVTDLTEAQEIWRDAMAEDRALLDTNAEGMGLFGVETEIVEEAMDGAATAISTFFSELRKLTDPVGAAKKASEDADTAQTNWNEALDEFGPTSAEAQSALGELIDADLELNDALLRLDSEGGAAYLELAGRVAGDSDEAGEAVAFLAGDIAELEAAGAATALELTTDLLPTLDEVASEWVAEMDFIGGDQMLLELDDLGRQLRALTESTWNVRINTTTSGSVPGGVQVRDSGGPIGAGQWMFSGVPELIVPRQDSWVVDPRTTSRIMAGLTGGGGQGVNANVTVNVGSVRSGVDIEQAVRRGGDELVRRLERAMNSR